MDEQNHKVNILVECGGYIPSVKLGVLEPLKYLRMQGLIDVRFCLTTKVNRKILEWSDVFVCVRGFEQFNINLVSAAKKSGRKVIYYIDDDLMNLPKDCGTASIFNLVNGKNNIKKILSKSDALWVSNRYLGHKYLNDNQQLIVTDVPAELNDVQKKKNDVIKVVYAGSQDHSKTIQDVLIPAIKEINNKYKDSFSFTFIGADPNYSDSNIKHCKYINSYDKYKEIMKNGNYDIGIALIPDGEFYKCKYYNKFVEYTSNSIVGLYSDTEPYSLIVNNKQNGILVGKDPKTWTDAFLFVLNNKKEIKDYLYNSQELIKEKFSYEKIGKQLIEEASSLLLSKPVNKGRVFIWPSYIVYVCEIIKYSFKKYGLLAPFIFTYKITSVIWGKIKERIFNDC